MEMDKNIWEAFCQELNITVSDGYHNDLELGELSTADGYEVYYLGNANDLNYDSDLFYYKPSFDDIVDRIKEHQYDDEVLIVGCYDIDEWFDSYEVIDYLMGKLDEDKLEELNLL